MILVPIASLALLEVRQIFLLNGTPVGLKNVLKFMEIETKFLTNNIVLSTLNSNFVIQG